jgi:hypothetical protein
MFRDSKRESSVPKPASSQQSLPLTDPETQQPLEPKDTPGYYPGFSTLAQQKYWDPATRNLVRTRINESTPIRLFTPEEARTMASVCDRLLPQEDRSAGYRIEILAGIDQRLFEHRIDGYRYEDMPSDEDAYRIAARAFEEMAQEIYAMPFDELQIMQQETLLQSIHDGKPIAAAKLWNQMNVERFWSLLLSDCCSAYYAHPFAWDEVGFGGPAYPRGYMRLEEGEPEPWEVNEQRYEWNAPADSISDAEQSHDSADEHQTRPGQAGTH